MRVDVVLRYVGVVMLFIALFMLLSAGISFVSGMDSAFYPLLLSSLLTALLGAFPLIFVGKREQITNKEGFCIVVGAWLVGCVVTMFPYLIWGGEFSLVNAWFESVSGFTTTGSTILNDVEALPRGLQFWRFSTTWVGGMGVVMFALLILPSLGRNKLTLSNVELSTLAKDNYRYRTQIIVQILLVVYVGLTVVSTLLLKMAGMNWFDSLCHAMSACATSGFSTKNASIAYFNSPAIDTILIFAMATAGVHFGLIYATVTGKRSNIFRSEVTCWYFGMLLAGGVLIAPGALTDFCPLYNSDGAPENTISQFDKKDVENVGLVKFDFLGLTTLSILAKCKEYIDKLYPEREFELERIPVTDEETYRCFQNANTAAVFQFESEGMRQLLRQARPDRLEDLVALNALYRPGPMDLIPSFIARKFGREKVEYLDERMAPVLSETYGIMVYQEQVMRVAQVVGGYSLGGADLLRRAMGKKNVEEMKRQRAVFVKGAGERGVKASVATEIFNLMEKFAGYGFNKSHAAAYSYVAYQTAYLKTHFTSCFMAANLCMVMDQGDKMKALLDDARSNGIEILPPDINLSDWFFTAPDEKHIRFGLGGVKGLGRQQVEDMMATRIKDGPFTDLFDVTARVSGLNSRNLEGLIRVGAFDSLNPDRGFLYGNVSQAMTAGQAVAASEGQDSLFADDVQVKRIVNWVEAPSWSERRKLKEEKGALGFWLSGHPYELYQHEVAHYTSLALGQIQPSRDSVKLAGVVTNVRVVQGKRGRMGVVQLDDGTAVLEVVCFSEAWEKLKNKFAPDDVVCIEGRVRYDEFSKRMSVNVENAMSLDEFRSVAASCLRVDIDGRVKHDVRRIESILRGSERATGVTVALDIRTKKASGRMYLPFTVGNVDELRTALRNSGEISGTEIEY